MSVTTNATSLAAGVAALAGRVPALQGLRPSITPLGGGITNRNFRLEADGKCFVLRVGGANTELLGIDRRNELIATQQAAAIGVGPEVEFFVEPECYLVTRCILGRPVPLEEMRQPATIGEVAAIMRRVHALPALRTEFSPFRMIVDYRRLADVRGVGGYPADVDWLFEQARTIEIAFAAGVLAACLCHNDLLAGNFLRETATGRLRLLDWEYAGMGNPYFDLANLAEQHGFGPEDELELLWAYFGEVRPEWLARLGLMRIMSNFREAMWGMLQSALSNLDFDYRGYAAGYFGRVSAGLQHPQAGEWLALLGQGPA